MTTQDDDPTYTMARSSLMWLMGLAKQRSQCLRGATRCRDRARRERERADDAERLCVELWDALDCCVDDRDEPATETMSDEQRAAVKAMRARMQGETK